MSGGIKIAQFIVSELSDTLPVFVTWLSGKCFLMLVCNFPFFLVFFFFYSAFFSWNVLCLSIIIMIFEVSTTLERYCTLVRNAEYFGGRVLLCEISINILYMENVAMKRAGGGKQVRSSERISVWYAVWREMERVCTGSLCGTYWVEQIDMDGENKLENKINIVYYVHWLCSQELNINATKFRTLPKCSAIYMIGIWILSWKSSTIYFVCE